MHDGSTRLDGALDEVEAMRSELEQLRTALSRRPVIDMAKGAIMALTRCDEDAAFGQLSQVSQAHNVKLFDLAAALLADLRGPGTGTRPADRLVQENRTRR